MIRTRPPQTSNSDSIHSHFLRYPTFPCDCTKLKQICDCRSRITSEQLLPCLCSFNRTRTPPRTKSSASPLFFSRHGCVQLMSLGRDHVGSPSNYCISLRQILPLTASTPTRRHNLGTHDTGGVPAHKSDTSTPLAPVRAFNGYQLSGAKMGLKANKTKMQYFVSNEPKRWRSILREADTRDLVLSLFLAPTTSLGYPAGTPPIHPRQRRAFGAESASKSPRLSTTSLTT